jgi:hypothetical protein
MIAGRRPEAVVAYRCKLCLQWHDGTVMTNRAVFELVVAATIAALQADPRVGWRGILKLADVWHPDVSERDVWTHGLDQRAAYA